MIKAKYYYKDCVVGAVKFDHDRAGQPLCTRVILANAPTQWDVCRWDQGEIQAPRKKRKPVEAEESTEITVSEDE